METKLISLIVFIKFKSNRYKLSLLKIFKCVPFLKMNELIHKNNISVKEIKQYI